MKYYIAKYNGCWADEMDLDGFVVLNEQSYEKLQKVISIFKQKILNEESDSFDGWYDREWYVGTNQGVEYEYINDVIFEEIDKNTYNALNSVFSGSFGYFPDYMEFCSSLLTPEEYDELDFWN